MSGAGSRPPSSRRGGGAGKDEGAAPSSPSRRAGYRTMPNDLRAFRRTDVVDVPVTPELDGAAEKLRELGRGEDVLFDSIHERAPREPSPDDNRSEQAVVELPPRGGAAAESGGAKAGREGTSESGNGNRDGNGNGDGAPSSNAPASLPAAAARAVREKGRGGRRRQAWRVPAAVIALSGVIAALVLVYGPRGGRESGSGSDDSGTMSGMGTAVMSGSAAGAMSVPGATGATSGAPSATSPEPSATGTASVAPAESGAATAATAATTASTVTTVKIPPTATAEPHVDAGAAPKPTSAASGTSTVAPAVSSAPATGTPVPPPPPYEDP